MATMFPGAFAAVPQGAPRPSLDPGGGTELLSVAVAGGRRAWEEVATRPRRLDLLCPAPCRAPFAH